MLFGGLVSHVIQSANDFAESRRIIVVMHILTKYIILEVLIKVGASATDVGSMIMIILLRELSFTLLF